jgi:hypothetical protein
MTTLTLRDLAFLGGLAAPATGPASLVLLHGNSSPIVDSSTYGRTITISGSPAPSISSTPSKFGGGSIYFPNTVGSTLTLPSDALLAFGTGDFTVEAFLYQNTFNLYSTLLEIGNHLNTTGIVFIVGSGGAQIYSGAFYGSGAVSLNAWNHIAWVRQLGVLNIYVNGTRTSSTPFANDLSATGPFTIGGASTTTPVPPGGYTMDGYMNEFRATRSALYSGTTLTVPTAPFADF